MLDAKVGLEKQDQKIIDEAVRWRKGIIIAVNKWDLIEKETQYLQKILKMKLKTSWALQSYIPIIFISALTKQRIFKLIEQNN